MELQAGYGRNRAFELASLLTATPKKHWATHPHRKVTSLLDHVLELMTHDSRLMTFHAAQVFASSEDLRGVELSFYCNAINRPLKHAHDAPTIGLILCQTRDRVLAENAFAGIDKPIGISTYKLTRALPKLLRSGAADRARTRGRAGAASGEAKVVKKRGRR
jgi:hypothetical protein